MARVEDCRETHARLQGSHHDAMHFIIDDVAVLAKVDGIDDLIVTIRLVAV